MGALAWACAFASVALLIQYEKRRHIPICGLSLHYHTNGTIFGKKNVTGHKTCILTSSTTFFSETFRNLRRIQRDMILNVKASSFKIPVVLVGFQ